MKNQPRFEVGDTVKIIKHREGPSQALGIVKAQKKNEVWIEVQKHRSTHPYVIKVPISKVRSCLTRKRVARNDVERAVTEVDSSSAKAVEIK